MSLYGDSDEGAEETVASYIVADEFAVPPDAAGSGPAVSLPGSSTFVSNGPSVGMGGGADEA